jgi:hypothetical protein
MSLLTAAGPKARQSMGRVPSAMSKHHLTWLLEKNSRNIRSHRAGQAEQVQTTFRVPPVKFSPEQTGVLNVFFGFRLLAAFVRTPFFVFIFFLLPCLF